MRIFLLISFLAFANQSFAEYSGWFIKFSITKEHEKITGYIYFAFAPDFDRDSVHNKEYVISRFDGLDGTGKPDTIHFARNRIRYMYNYGGRGTDTSVVYKLIDPDSIPVSEIQDIQILEMFLYTIVATGTVATGHSFDDTVWMNQKPVQTTIFAVDILCDWQIFVHERTKQTDRVLSELNLLTDDYEAGKVEPGIGYEQIFDILQKFEGTKVVVIRFCSC